MLLFFSSYYCQLVVGNSLPAMRAVILRFYSMVTVFVDQALVTGGKVLFAPQYQAVENDIQIFAGWRQRIAVAWRMFLI